MDNFFISALVQASSCRKHAKHTLAWRDSVPAIAQHHRPRRRRPSGLDEGVRCFRRGASQRGDANSAAEIGPADEPTREEFKQLVDIYGPNDGHLETWKEQEERERREAEEEAKKAREAGETPENSGPSKSRPPHEPWPNNDEVESESIGELEELLEHDGLSPEIAYEIYTSLSWPRVAYLPYQTIRALLNCLGVVEHPSESAMLRYLSVIDDMKAAGIPITRVDWNMAIQYAGKCMRKITSSQVESALYIWREMEHEAGVKGNYVTFNILFDIAVKAGKYNLAEMIKKEMEDRNLRFDRYFRTSYIMWNGFMGDGHGVREGYKELVDAGEIVDTSVMNCVITALIKAGEGTAAEQVFLRMKKMDAERSNRKQMPRNWRQLRELGILLNRAAEQARDDPEMRQKVQDETPVAPDYGTFKTLVEYHAITSGNIDRVTELLDEMDKVYRLPLRGDMFYTLFFGFHFHGGIRYSSWTKGRLESTWRAYLLSLDKSTEGFYLHRTIVMAVIVAFAKCTNKDRTMQVLDEIKGRWKQAKEADMQAIHGRLAVLFPATSA